jgi:predicted PurR-regulated permease PerM
VQNAEHGRGWIGHLVHRFHLEAWVTRNASKLQSLGATLAKPALTVGKGAASLLATLGTIFVLIVLFLLEGPKMRQGLLGLMQPGRAAYYTRVAGEISQSATGYALGNVLTSLIAGVVVFVTLTVLGVPFPLLWALWVALVDFLPMVGGALAGIPTVLFALGHSLTAGIVTATAFIAYQQIENHVLNPVVMSRTVKVNPLLVLLSLLVGTSIGDWIGGFFGSFVAALISIPVAGALQVITREIWQATETDRSLRDGEQEPTKVELKAPTFDLSGGPVHGRGPVPVSPFAIAGTNARRVTSSFLPRDYRVDWVSEQQFRRSTIKEADNEDYGIQLWKEGRAQEARPRSGADPPGRSRSGRQQEGG